MEELNSVLLTCLLHCTKLCANFFKVEAAPGKNNVVLRDAKVDKALGKTRHARS